MIMKQDNIASRLASLLREKQIKIAKKAIISDVFKDIRLICGFDLAFKDKKMFCAGILMELKTFKIIDVKTTICIENFPYIPTFLSFREMPPILTVFNNLERKPDLLFINGHGIAHPVKCGIATHIGVLLNIPSIGIAKNILIGKFSEPQVGEAKPLIYSNEQLGWVLKTSENTRPIVISPGNMVSLETSLKLTKSCIRNHKLPEPIALAHKYANLMKIIYDN